MVNLQRNPFLRGLGAAGDPVGVETTPAVQQPVDAGGTSLEMIPASIAQQIFAVTSGVAGGLVGFVLAYKLRNALMVSTAEVVIASAVVIAATFGSIFLFRTVQEYPEVAP